MKVYIINSITKSYILNIKIRQLVTEYALMIKLVDGTSSAHSFNPHAYFGHSWSYFDIQNLRLVILYFLNYTIYTYMRHYRNCHIRIEIMVESMIYKYFIIVDHCSEYQYLNILLIASLLLEVNLYPINHGFKKLLLQYSNMDNKSTIHWIKLLSTNVNMT